ncbi:Ig-like domain-containing protein [Marinoscillum pacificum]|uniref:Ig-like domain-containing protein n=1 Tax=Marinoscillum pacificum TaxID=392723 RepID=UPI0021582D17|nr:Ig-like domain-containing protein [Marinoscillum pacificum]
MKVKMEVRMVSVLVLLVHLLGGCNAEEPEPSEVLVTSLSIRGEFIEDGSTSQLSVVVTPENATNQEVSWTVSNEDVATISDSGLLTAVTNGIVTVTATASDGSGVFATKSIKVSGVQGPQVLVESISINGQNIDDGKEQQLNAEVLPANATNKDIEWSVSDETVAEITAEGLLKPLKNGNVTVKVRATDASGVEGEKEISISGVVVVTDGTVVDNSNDLLLAIGNANPGDKIYVRGGSYAFGSTISMNRDGSEGNVISLIGYPNDSERPVFNFSSMAENSSNRGIQLSGDFWHVKGIDVYNAGDNGMFISGNNNLVEFCYFYENADSGLQIGNGAANNTVLNCDSYYNADSSIENADGFACKLDAGDGNKFIGCRAWQNLDDGWDGYLRGADNITTTYENCWAFLNGQLKDGSVGGGDGNGFKTGGSDDKSLKHHAIYKNCIAAGNVVDGFDHNSNRGDVTLYNCGAYDNGRNINFGSSNIANSLTIKNTISFAGGGDSYQATITDITNNGWQNGITTNTSDFVSVDIDLLKSPRKADGSLPDIDFVKIQSGSDLIDAGIDVGISFEGSAPDLGPFEFEN